MECQTFIPKELLARFDTYKEQNPSLSCSIKEDRHVTLYKAVLQLHCPEVELASNVSAVLFDVDKTPEYERFASLVTLRVCGCRAGCIQWQNVDPEYWQTLVKKIGDALFKNRDLKFARFVPFAEERFLGEESFICVYYWAVFSNDK